MRPVFPLADITGLGKHVRLVPEAELALRRFESCSLLVAIGRRTVGVLALGTRIVAFRGGIICVIAVG